MRAGERSSLLRKPPIPLVGGGALRAASLLEYLAQSYTVDAIVFRTPERRVDLPSGLVDRLDTIELPRHSKHTRRASAQRPSTAAPQPAAGRPLQRIRRRNRRVARGSPGLRSRPWSSISGALPTRADRPAMPPHGSRPAQHRVGLAPGQRQGGSMAAIGRTRDLPPGGHRSRAALAAALFSAADDLPQDAERVRQIAPGARVVVYPNAIPLVSRPPREEQDIIVFSGTLEYEPNRTAVRYFAAEIWPALRDRWPGLKWRLIGRNPEAVERYVTGDPGIECTGPVEDAMSYLAAAKVAVAPILSGSGTRLKIVEAWAAGVPVVSTTLGAEGLPGAARRKHPAGGRSGQLRRRRVLPSRLLHRARTDREQRPRTNTRATSPGTPPGARSTGRAGPLFVSSSVRRLDFASIRQSRAGAPAVPAT